MNLRRAESRQREHESQARYTLESPTPLHGYLLFLFCEIAMPCTFKAVPPGLQNAGLLELTSCRSQRRNTAEPIPCPEFYSTSHRPHQSHHFKTPIQRCQIA